jgi:voltage-gated potassium channel
MEAVARTELSSTVEPLCKIHVPPPSETPDRLGYQIFVLTISVAALLLLLVQSAVPMNKDSSTIFEYADDALCMLFLVDFLVCVVRAPNRMRYLATWGWLDLLACVPTFEVARWGRMARVLRIFRVMRAVRAARVLAQVILERKAENSMFAAGLIVLLLVFGSSIAILNFETTPEANIKSPEDALWWAVATVTTVGYGDRYPVTTEGRFVAAVLMCAGVGLFGTLSAFLASMFIESDTTEDNNELSQLRAEVGALRQLIEERLPVR